MGGTNSEPEQSHGHSGHPQRLLRTLSQTQPRQAPSAQISTHRVTEWVRGEGTTRGHLLPPPCTSRVTPEHSIVSRGLWKSLVRETPRLPQSFLELSVMSRHFQGCPHPSGMPFLQAGPPSSSFSSQALPDPKSRSHCQAVRA